MIFFTRSRASERGFDSLAPDCYRAAPFTAWREPHHYLRNLSLSLSFVNEGKKAAAMADEFEFQIYRCLCGDRVIWAFYVRRCLFPARPTACGERTQTNNKNANCVHF